MAAPNAEQQAIVAGAAGAFDQLYGLEILELGETVASARVQVRAELKQPMGLVHGGVYASVAESLASIATARAVRAQSEFAVGLANSTSFLRPITEGTIHARAQRLHRGRTTWVWDVTFTDDAGKTCAVTRMTVAVRPQH
jgi:1,4-dihydroxy-2-naphthoyl-CoA hydrolase